MSGFGVWAASIQGTAAIAGCMLVLGTIIGWLAGTRPRGVSRRERRELADRAADRAAARAAGQFRAMREPGPAIYVPPAYAVAAVEAFKRGEIPPEVAHEWEPVHVAQALALASPDPSVTAWTQQMAERFRSLEADWHLGTDRFLEELCGVPYSADELWNGQ